MTAGDEDLRLLTLGDVMQLLGLSSATIRRWVAKGELPVVRLRPSPTSIRFRRSDIEALIERPARQLEKEKIRE